MFTMILLTKLFLKTVLNIVYSYFIILLYKMELMWQTMQQNMKYVCCNKISIHPLFSFNNFSITTFIQ